MASQSSKIVTMLPNNDIVRKVYTNPEDGILSGLLPGTFLIDSSTVDPAVSKEVAELSTVILWTIAIKNTFKNQLFVYPNFV